MSPEKEAGGRGNPAISSAACLRISLCRTPVKKDERDPISHEKKVSCTLSLC